MAVVDLYTNSNVEVGKLSNSAFTTGAEIKGIVCVAELAAADSNASVYRIARVGANMIPIKIEINNDAITSGTDYDLGLYKIGSGGLVKDKDCFADGVSMASARVMGAEVSGLSAVGIEDMGKKVYEYAGDTIGDKQTSYDLCLTANVAGTAGGTVLVRALFVQG